MLHPRARSAGQSCGRLVRAVLWVLLLTSLPAGGAVVAGDAEAQSGGPPVLHPIEGREGCTQCHRTTGSLAVPTNHVGRANETCLLCHAAATATPTTAPTLVPTTAAAPATTAAPSSDPWTFCLTCHSVPGLTMTFSNGDTVALTFPVEAYRQSVHGNLLLCEACHSGHREVPHPSLDANSRRGYAIARYEACKACHFVNYTKTLDSVHFRALSVGQPDAPVCTDCHGAHNVSSPDHPRSGIPQICAKCHAEIYRAYEESVHGQALTDTENQDVPTCTDCHGVHNVRGATSNSFHLEIPQLCGSCHADGNRMAKYGLSTRVLTTYLQDFHGMTVTLAREKKDPDILSYEAVCTDCHGIHDIVSTKVALSPVLKTNLAGTCQRCHSGATKNFPAAWLSHYEPSLERAPLVFLIKFFYRIFIPLVVGGLVIQVATNIWSMARRR
ncbi:MAG: cytochrome C [Chloroflexi bacterium]|nr:cytochrome C [Chloroflexota bacterium]